jgi:CHASE1-domain containing sensor protein
MIKFLGILVVILLPLIVAAVAIGRRLEASDVKMERDRAIRDGMNALKRRVMNLERLRGARRERRG